MKLVFTGASGDADDRARGLSIFRTVGVSEHLEFSDGINRRVNQNGAIRTDVIVVHAVDQEKIVGGGISVYREIRTTLQALSLRIELVGGRDAGLKRRQRHEVAAVQRKFANLGAF